MSFGVIEPDPDVTGFGFPIFLLSLCQRGSQLELQSWMHHFDQIACWLSADKVHKTSGALMDDLVFSVDQNAGWRKSLKGFVMKCAERYRLLVTDRLIFSISHLALYSR